MQVNGYTRTTVVMNTTETADDLDVHTRTISENGSLEGATEASDCMVGCQTTTPLKANNVMMMWPLQGSHFDCDDSQIHSVSAHSQSFSSLYSDMVMLRKGNLLLILCPSWQLERGPSHSSQSPPGCRSRGTSCSSSAPPGCQRRGPSHSSRVPLPGYCERRMSFDIMQQAKEGREGPAMLADTPGTTRNQLSE